MSHVPDSSLRILRSIDQKTLNGDHENARYALLMSMALDKNYVDTTTFDVLYPAINYYSKKGSADDKLRTLYYQARIYQNKSEYDSAMYCFLNGKELFDQATDTMTMANLLVAQATIEYCMYKFEDYIKNNIKAAEFNRKMNRFDYEVTCLGNALDGCIINNNKSLADSILEIIKDRVERRIELNDIGRFYILNYLLNFGDKVETMNLISYYESLDSIEDLDKIAMATAYYKLGYGKEAKRMIDNIASGTIVRNSLKYLAIRSNILEQNGDYKGALESYKDFSATADSIDYQIFTQDLLFAQQKHDMEKSNLIEINKRDRNFWIMVSVSFALLFIVVTVAYLYRLARIQNKLDETEKSRLNIKNENLKNLNEKLELEKQNVILEKRSVELERQKTLLEKLAAEKESKQRALEAENLKKENENLQLRNRQAVLEKQNIQQEKDKLELERQKTQLEKQAAEKECRQRALEAENLTLKIHELEDESAGLKEILKNKDYLTKPAEEAIRVRLQTLNKLVAQKITDRYKNNVEYEDWCNELIKDNDEFMTSTRLAYKAMNPRFINYLEQCALTEEEINYSCLYAIGLRGKEVGKYISKSRHYHMSSDIRKKLGIDSHDTNLGIYIRKLLQKLQ